MFSSSTSPRLTYHWWRSAPIRIDVVLLKFLRANLQSHHKKVLLTARIRAQRKKHAHYRYSVVYICLHTLFPSVSNLALSHRQQSRMHEQVTIGNPCTQTSLTGRQENLAGMPPWSWQACSHALPSLSPRPWKTRERVEVYAKGPKVNSHPILKLFKEVQCHKAVSTICVCTIARSIQYQL